MVKTEVLNPSIETADCGELTGGGRVRVLHVISGLFYGGGQRVVVDLLRELACLGELDCRLCTLGRGGTILDDLADASVTYDGRYNSPSTLWRASRELRQELRKERIDVLHTHGVDADLIGGLAVRGTGVSQVCHLHITPGSGKRESWKAGVRRRLLRHLTNRDRTRFIAVSEAVRQEMAEYYRLPLDRIVTIRNGVELSEFTLETPRRERTGEKELVIGTAGRLEPMKGLEHLLAAAGVLESRGVRFELRIAGKGSKQRELEEQAASLGVGERVRFVGHVSDMPTFYGGLDAFVLASVSTEGLPLVVLEAMATGAAVVATDVGGTREVIEDGVNGFLVSSGNAEALAEALERLACDEELRLKLARAGAERVRENFTVERVAAEVAAVYERVMGER